MSCSFGAIAGSGPCSRGKMYTKEDFTKDERLLLKARSGLQKLKNVCESHKLSYLALFESRQKVCCDPFNKHAKGSTGDLRLISKEMYLKSLAMPQIEGSVEVLIPGKKLCKRCYMSVKQFLDVVEEYGEPASSCDTGEESQDLFADSEEAQGSEVGVSRQSPVDSQTKDPSSSQDFLEYMDLEDEETSLSAGEAARLESAASSSELKGISSTGTSSNSEDHEVESSDSVFDPAPESQQAIAKINQSLSVMGQSPVTKRKLTSSTSYVPSKLKKIEDQYAALMAVGGAANVTEDTFEHKVLNALLNKFQNSSGASEKILVLSVALSGFTHRKVLEIFGPHGATDYLIKKNSTLMAEQGGILPMPLPKKGRPLPEETLRLVDAFYNSEKVTYQLPGKKDCIIMRVNGEKVPVPKKLILCTLRELFSLFQEENPHVTVSFSKFASLRPKHCVIAGSAGTHTVCVCIHHQNFKLMIEGSNFKNFKHQTDKNFIRAVVCESPTSECYLEIGCPNCPDTDLLKESLLDFYCENFVEEVTFSRWSDKVRSSLETVLEPTEDFVKCFISSLKKLLPHHFIAKKQAQYFENVKSNLKEGEILTICDFSENFSFLVQESVQSYYWSNDQATLHPFASYYMEDGVLKFIGFIIISEYMKHIVQAFYAFQKKFITFIRSIVPHVVKIIYFSDGATSQYKNLYNMINQTYHKEDFQIESEWNFFASYHGKGPSDGLGGQFKCSAARASTQKCLIRNPKELYNWGIGRTGSSIKLAFVSTQEVEEVESFLQPRFEKALEVKGIRSLHCCIPVSVGELMVRKISLADTSYFRAVELIRKVPDWSSMEPGDFITVLSKSNWCLAEIENKDEESKELLLLVLKRSREKGTPRTYFYTLPEEEEETAVSVSEVLTVVKPLYDAQRKLFTICNNDLNRTLWQLKSALA